VSLRPCDEAEELLELEMSSNEVDIDHTDPILIRCPLLEREVFVDHAAGSHDGGLTLPVVVDGVDIGEHPQ